MISVIITAREEERTIARAIKAFLSEDYKDDFEIIVVAPDRQTLKAARQAWPKVKMVQDRDRGKALAMNLAIAETKGEKLIFSDGDVEINKGAVEELLKKDGDLVTGRPMAINKPDNMLAWWQACLVDMADRLRGQRDKQGEFLLLSGYLFMAKKEVFKEFKFAEDLLTEDEYLSYWAWQRGYIIRYTSLAGVKVVFPNNYTDWAKQKIRTLAGGYQIPKDWKKNRAMRTFGKESLQAWQMWKNYVKNFKQAGWMSLLFIARLDVWLRGFIKVKVLKQSRYKVWQRVESTK